jgi:nucleotide-binding universal stress UspA family protein
MARAPERFMVRRITVALDSSPHARAALAAAVDLAARLHAKMDALFVEDITYAYLAELNLGHEFVMSSGRSQPFDPQALEGWYRRQAADARRMAEALARDRHLTLSFRVVRGKVDAEVITAASNADLLVLGVAGRSEILRQQPGSTALAAAARAPGSVLLIRPGTRVAGHAVVAYDGSPGAVRALEAAAMLAEADEALRISVLLLAVRGADTAALKADAAARLESMGVRPIGFRVLFNIAGEAMCGVVYDAGADLLILSADNPAVAGDSRGQVLGAMRCPVLLVR